MQTALYYPNISIENVGLVKKSLLLWDKLEYISPFGDYYVGREESDYKKAVELICSPHIPTHKEKKLAHDLILELVYEPLPDWFLAIPSDESQQYQIYPQKFLPETWEQLETLEATRPMRDSYLMSQSFGLSIMAILADCCAGEQKQLVTDKTDIYSALTRYLTRLNGGEYVDGMNEHDRLITISVKTLCTKPIEMQKLIQLRAKEKTDKTGHVRQLRHNYLKKINEYVVRVSSEAKHANDVREIERQFDQEMTDDLGALYEELKMNAKDAIFSREMATAIICVAGAPIEPFSAATIATGALLNKRTKYRTARKVIQKNHPMAWLHASNLPQLY